VGAIFPDEYSRRRGLMVDSNYERAIKEQIIYTNDWESCTNLVDTKRVGGFKNLEKMFT